MISQDKSEWEETLLYYRALGFSEDEAFLAAMKEQGRKMLKDGAAGAITGTIMSGGRLAGSKIQDGIQNYRNYREAVQNGRRYYALNNITKGNLAQLLGNMNVEQDYKQNPPPTLNSRDVENLSLQGVRQLMEKYGYFPEENSRGKLGNLQRNRANSLQSGNAIDNSSGDGTMEISEKQRINDPMVELTGDAMVSHPKEIERIIADLESAGVEILYGKGSIGYGHGLKPGEPGQFHVAPGASYSAWCHEYKHFCDDRANGYLGTEKASKNRSMRMRMEFDAYQLEIDMAKEANRLDIVERLEKLRDKEILRISAKGGPVW